MDFNTKSGLTAWAATLNFFSPYSVLGEGESTAEGETAEPGTGDFDISLD